MIIIWIRRNGFTLLLVSDNFEWLKSICNITYENILGEQSHHFPIPVEGGPSALPGLNITVHAIDDMAKECLEPKISKAKAKLLNKRRKEKGLEYTRPDKTVMSARKIRAPCDCRLKCRKKYSDAIRAKLLQNFLNLKLSGQNQFLASHITVTKTARPMVSYP